MHPGQRGICRSPSGSIAVEAARALVKRLRLPRQWAIDGKALMAADFEEVNHTRTPVAATQPPMRRNSGAAPIWYRTRFF